MEFVIFIDLFEIARSMFPKLLFYLEDIPLIDVYSFRCYGTYVYINRPYHCFINILLNMVTGTLVDGV